MSDQLDVLKDVARRLEKAAIPYMVSGSVAMTFYALPRMTRDIDIVIELSAPDAARISKLFAGDFYVDEEDVRECIKTAGMFNIIHNRSMVKIDFILRKSSDYRETEFRRRRAIEIEGVAVSVVTPEDLLLSKLEWAQESQSELQLGDIRNLINQRADLDWSYISSWADRLGLGTALAKLRRT